MILHAEGLSQIASGYDGILCDVWGVLHNGVRAWPGAINALQRFREGGGTVVMITNAPRPHGPVIRQLDALGVPHEVYDAVVTSGDVTRDLIRITDGPVFYLGPDRDHILFEGIDVSLAQEDEAKAVVCTGLIDDTTEAPDNYSEMLLRFRARNLPFICANPDIVVEKGDRLLWCAGALARDYAALGGETLIAGKPHAPIYEAAMEILNEKAGRQIDKSRVLAIGDGMPTDVAGALGNGFDLLYVSAGIHAAEYGDADMPDRDTLEAFLAEGDARPAATMPRLVW